MDKRQFFKSLSWLLLLNVLVKPIWVFLIDRKAQNTLGHQVYGTYFALFNLSYILLFIADAGLSNMMVQRLAANPNTSARQYLNIKICLLLFYGLTACFIGWISGITVWSTFLYLVLLQIAGSLLVFFRSLLTANHLFKTDAIFSIADKALLILSCSVFLYGWWQPITLDIFLQLQIATTFIANIFLLPILIRKRLISQGETEKISRIAQQILPFGIIILLMALHYRLDGFLLKNLRTDGALQAGIYATAYRLLDAANMVGYLTASFLVPYIARHENEKPLVLSVTALSRHVLMALAITVSCFALVFSGWIQETLYHTTDPFNSVVIQLCLAVLPAYYLTHIYGSVLTATGRLKSFINILLISVLLNSSLNLFLIPAYGAAGSCIAALASQYFCAFACYFFVRKQFDFPFSYRSWLFYISHALILLPLLFILKMVIHNVWIILAALVLMISVLLSTTQKTIKPLLRSFIQ